MTVEAVHGRLRKGKGARVDQGSLLCGRFNLVPAAGAALAVRHSLNLCGAAEELHESKLGTCDLGRFEARG
jgi:hypothetical protein